MEPLMLGQIRKGECFVGLSPLITQNHKPIRKDLHSCFSVLENSGWKSIGALDDDNPVMRIDLPDFIKKMGSH